MLAREASIAGAYLAITLVATYPLVLSFRSAIPPGGDTLQFYWNLWWVKRALVDLHTSPLFTPDLYFPNGADLHFHTLNLLPSVLAVPVAAAWGLPAAYNFLVFLAFTLTGYGMYRLALYVLAHEIHPGRASNDLSRRSCAAAKADARTDRGAAFVAGVTFTCSSYHFAHLHGHLDLVSTQWLPFFGLFLLKTRDESRWINPLLCGTFLAATALTSFYYLLFLLVFTAILAVHTIVGRGRDALPAARRLGVALATFALLASPILMPMLILGRTEGRSLDPGGDMVRFSTDAVTFVLPSPLHPLWGGAMTDVYRSLFGTNAGYEQVAFLGYVPLILAAVGICRLTAARTFWLAASLFFVLLALGPVAHAGGRVVPLLSSVMPYRLIARLPYGDIPRVPVRFVVMAQLCVSVLAGCGTWSLLQRMKPSHGQWAIAAIAASALFENAAVPLPVQAVDVPPFVARLGRTASRAGVLEVPIPDDPSIFPQRMLFQTVHEQPIYQGYVSRGFPPLPFAAVPGFAQFKTLSPALDDVVSYDRGQLRDISRRALAAYGAGHVVIEKTFLRDAAGIARARAIADELFGESAREDEDAWTLAYTVPRDEGPGPTAVWLDTGWSYLEHLDRPGTTDGLLRWRWMGDRARVTIMSGVPAAVRLKLTAQAFRRLRHVKLSIGATEIATLAIVTERTDDETPSFQVPAGLTFIDFRSLEGAESPGADPRRLSVAMFRIELIETTHQSQVTSR